MNKKFNKVVVTVFLATFVFASYSAAQWESYDESEDLALLAQHENERMHFRLLNSKVLDKNSLWEPFASELANFSELDYLNLKPLILDRSISEIQQSVNDGSLTYEQLATFYIYRIREIESDNMRYINGVIALNPDAINRARRLDEIRQPGTTIPNDSIFGIPVLLKDNINAEGMATTAGAIALQNNHADNAFIADRLLERGAVILGKANLSEWAYFFCDDCPSGYSAMGGQTLNPYGRFEFGTGGSSSGSGASTAANYATVAVGSETSGSILSPSSANSLVGLKPTTGSISRTGVVPISATLDTTGPMTRSVQDAVILFNAMAGYDEADTAMPLISVDMQLIYRDEGLAGKRLGAMEQYAENEFYQHALSLFSQNEAVIVELSFEAERQARFGEFLGVEMVRDLALYLEQHAADEVLIDSIASLKAFNEQDMDVRAPYGQAEVDRMDELLYTSMQIEELRAELQDSARSQLDRLFAESNIDVLLSINNFQAGIAALANYPALTIPMGYQEDGRPIGLTLIAPSFQEQILIDVGAEFERLTQARRTPEFYQ
ncbi:MAG: amidase family protein [Gammaproteobacteria bacterium]|nr:amidase family protein [Gammaproteobacteria bacterium]MDD9959243.1 amidase family protein [Gammaproteobacteria bacterium]